MPADHKVVICMTDEGFVEFEGVERVHNDVGEKRVVLIREGHQISLD